MRRKLLVGFLVLGVAYAAASAALYAVMLQPPARIGAMKARVPWMAVAFLPFEPLWTHARAGALSVGRPAEDFTLPTLDRKTSVRLSDAWREKPVVLIFGSYT